MTFPTIHLNGSHGPDLLEQIARARLAVATATSLLQDAAPNGRDYYPQGPTAYAAAAAEHGERVELLARVERELHDIQVNLDTQLAARRRT